MLFASSIEPSYVMLMPLWLPKVAVHSVAIEVLVLGEMFKQNCICHSDVTTCLLHYCFVFSGCNTHVCMVPCRLRFCAAVMTEEQLTCQHLLILSLQPTNISSHLSSSFCLKRNHLSTNLYFSKIC